MDILKLARQVLDGEAFFFGDRPDRTLIKSNDTHYVAPEGRRHIDPDVLVFQQQVKPNGGTKVFHVFEQEDK